MDDQILVRAGLAALLRAAPGIDVVGEAGSDEEAPPSSLAGLTPRETEVVRLVGRALSNGQIAETLQVSEATVKTHLNRLMAKPGLCSRAQVVVLAYDCGLVRPGMR
ncbi:helix-turn-helix transcriptional regulator [Sphaerisporangium sp. NPDC005288]|uniref:response regulator transcription factor n=1 Tax=Sphaerisporangium sp. NPDC005288 TaxID=3155114 RepID=UPI00339FF214